MISPVHSSENSEASSKKYIYGREGEERGEKKKSDTQFLFTQTLS
jgi:hypothetical protein